MRQQVAGRPPGQHAPLPDSADDRVQVGMQERLPATEVHGGVMLQPLIEAVLTGYAVDLLRRTSFIEAL